MSVALFAEMEHTIAASDSIKPNEEIDALFPQLPWVLIVTIAFLVSTICISISIMCQFEYRRKKYQRWKSLPQSTSSGHSTPTKHVRWRDGDIETSIENLIEPSPREIRRRLVKRRLKAAANLLKRHFSHRSRRSRRLRRSLSATNVMMCSVPAKEMASPMLEAAASSFDRSITGNHVKKALRVKSRRYRSGHFRPLNRPHTPRSTPLLNSKRHSRSLSDIVSLLSLEHLPKCAEDSPHPIEQPRQVYCDPTTAYSGSEASHSINVEFRQKRRKLLDKNTIEKLSQRRNRRLLTSPSTTSTLTASVSNGSISTLKPTASLSEFSMNSYNSGDPELEYDLYDCDLNNVAVPGSMFAPTLYFDLTPTEEDEFEMTELFPMLRNDSPNKPRQHITGDRKQMINSLTSDLAASVTSDDLTQRDSLCYNSDINLEDSMYGGETEREKLLVKSETKPQILNLTHIDDDISFADE